MTSWESAASALFASQHALATTRQLALLGVPRGVVRRRLLTGEWTHVRPGLVGLPGPRSWERSVHGAVLLGGPSTLGASGTAARVHGFDGFDRHEDIVVTSIGGAHIRPTEGVRRHRSRMVTGRHRIVAPNGIPVVSKPVALIQIAGEHGVDDAARALDGLLRDGASPRWIESVVQEFRRSGVRGPAVVDRLLHERVGATLPRSWFQRLAKRLLDTTGFRFVDEFPVCSADGELALLDLALPALRIGVECQSWSWHGAPGAQDRDNRRRRRLRTLGWDIVDVWWTDLDRMDEVLADILVLLERRHPSLPGL